MSAYKQNIEELVTVLKGTHIVVLVGDEEVISIA